MANGQNAKLAVDLAQTITNALVRDPQVPVKPSDSLDVQDTVEKAVSQSSVGNALNLEPVYQSRVLIGNAVAALGAVMPILVTLGWVTPDEGTRITAGISAAISLLGTLYSVYGRLWTGLKPLFAKKSV